MRHEIRKSAGETCPTCGSFELIHVAPTMQPLARELSVALAAPWWRPLLRRWVRKTERDFEARSQAFVEQTRFPWVEPR